MENAQQPRAAPIAAKVEHVRIGLGRNGADAIERRGMPGSGMGGDEFRDFENPLDNVLRRKRIVARNVTINLGRLPYGQSAVCQLHRPASRINSATCASLANS